MAGAGIFGVLTRHLHVAAERHCADAVLGIAACELQNLGAEAERERQNPDAVPASRKKMSQLVDEDQHAEHEQERQYRGQKQNLRLLILTRRPFHERNPGPRCPRDERFPLMRRLRRYARSSSARSRWEST